MSFVGEALLGSVGVAPFLRGKTVVVGLEARARAAKLPRAISRAARRLLGGERAEMRDYPAFDWKDVLGATTMTVTPERIVQQIGDPMIADDFRAAVERAIAYLRAFIPKRPPRGVFDTEPTPPTFFETDRMRAAWEIANDPMVAMHDLTAWCLSRDQAAAFSAIYPELYEMAGVEMQVIVGELRAAGTKRVLPWQAEKQIRTFAAGQVDGDLAKMLQANTMSDENPANPGQPVGGVIGQAAERVETPTLRVSGR